MSKPVDVVKAYYEAFDAHDFKRARTYLRDDFRFTGPMMQANSAEELFSKMGSVDCRFKNRVLHMVESGDTVGVLFDCEFSKPFSATLRMSEWFTVADGKLASSNLVYDASKMPGMCSA